MASKTVTLLVTALLVALPNAAGAQIIIAPGCPPGYILIPPDECVPEPPPITEPEPVIIIPGILASLNIKTTLLDEDGGKWQFLPAAKPVYQGLIERLEQAGADVFVAHYDWRQPAAENSLQYLKETIDQAKAATGRDTVDIVAHSFGGLVARDYIQGSQYAGDVDQLITLGTPHKGSADAYLAREGGIIPDRWSAGSRWYITLVERTLNARAGAAPIPRPESLRTFFPSLLDLVPTEPFVIRDSAPIPLEDMAARNLYLSARNDTLEADLGSAGVELVTLAGTGLGTLKNIPADEGSLIERALDALFGRWRDGHPAPDPPTTDTSEGDQTVTLASARLDTTAPISNIAHDKLPEELQEEVLDVLDITPTGTHLAYDLPESVLGNAVLSPLVATVHFPDGTSFTCDHTYTQGPASCLTDDTDPDTPKLLEVADPPTGEYTITYTGTDTGEYTVITTYADENETVSSVQEGATTAGEVTTEQVTISPETTSLIDDADFRALLQQLEQEIRQAKREGNITGRQWAQLHRPLEQAQQHLRQYDHAVKNGKQRDAEKHLRRYHQALDQLLEQLLGEWRQTAQKIKAYSPPLATH